jgi:hypothetical protein
MTSSAMASAGPSAQQLTPASSPPADMAKDNNKEGISDAMHQEEERMRTQREKGDAKREAQLEKERQEDIKSGRDVLDKKFQQLEFLMNKSKVGTPEALKRCVSSTFRTFTNICSVVVCDSHAGADATAGRRRESAR